MVDMHIHRHSPANAFKDALVVSGFGERKAY
jgi:hypothetical protein